MLIVELGISLLHAKYLAIPRNYISKHTVLDVVTLTLGSLLSHIRHASRYLVIPRIATRATQRTVQLASQLSS